MGKAIFLNLSNHPSSKWDEKQVAAASTYGEIIDIPFPEIDPAAGKDEIHDLASQYMQMISGIYSDNQITVHIMGEQTFCHALVTMLEKSGIKCVASCAARNATELPDGRKLSEFSFIRFREY